MTPRDPRSYLHDMLDSACFVREQAEGKTFEEFESNRIFRSAVERELMIVGEALYLLSRHAPEFAERIPASRQIIAFRHVLVHGYHALEAHRIWDVVTHHLTPLIDSLSELLRSLDDSEKED